VSFTIDLAFVDADLHDLQPAVDDGGDHAPARVSADLLARQLVLHRLHLVLHFAGLLHEPGRFARFFRPSNMIGFHLHDFAAEVLGRRH
jgi:hypothetical protein